MKNNILYETPVINGSGTVAVIDDFFKDSPFPFPDCPKIFIHASESGKTLATVERVIDRLVSLEADRDTFLIGMGGGITTDITGFVASIYKRGLRFGLVPTTLLAQVDAAVGGKNGVNFSRFKNVIGSFREPDWTFVNPVFLSTLSRRSLLCGAAEMLKIFIIRDRNAYEEAVECFSSESLNLEKLQPLVRRAIGIKCEIASLDPEDRGARRLLNLGHTFGHAIEKFDGNILHGEAVAIGIILAAKESVRLGIMQESALQQIESDFRRIGLPVTTSIDRNTLDKAILQDKKRSGGNITLVLPKEIGEAVLWETSVTA